MDETYWRRVDSIVTDTKETSVLIFQETEDVTFFYEYALLVSYGGATVNMEEDLSDVLDKIR